MQGEQEVFFQCPYCGEQISMVFETYYQDQEYIEDCEVCCRPISVSYSTDGEDVQLKSIERAQ